MSKLILLDALLFSVKQALLGSPDITPYADTAHGLALEGLPSCEIAGITSGRSCGFVTCPACEVSRRVRFGLHIVKAISGADNAYIVHQRVTAADLVELSSDEVFNSMQTWQFFRRLNGLVGTRINAGFDLSCRSWVFDRVAVCVGAPPAIYATTTARGIIVQPSAMFDAAAMESSRLPEFAGHLAAFVEHAVNLGPSPLDIVVAANDYGLRYVIDSVLAAQHRWREQGTRLHLLKLVEPRRQRDLASSDEPVPDPSPDA